MNLRKALDKAQKERQEDILSEGSSPSGDVASAKKQKVEADRSWHAPAYTESSQVRFNQGVLVENKCVCISPGAAEIDNYKVLRAQIMQRTKEKGWNTLMVTSAQPGEGKTLTAINLAITLAKEFNQTVLLVDCDLKKQDVHTRFGYQSDRGLGDYLLNDCSLNEIISWPGVEKMTLISGGQTIRDTTELLGSPQMKSLVAEMKERYADRYVIFDLPSLLEGADAITFAPLVDGILMVTQVGRNTPKEIDAALELIPTEKLLGFVLNRQA
ncbi:MAG: AAA family ATPase [Desulfobulbaceae bacterium]|nr:AAA family ATPase [Desulfobulbaceae bacterium]HIJ91210.1 AAA family ATPase [Deltaproteobacteria bacterium]